MFLFRSLLFKDSVFLIFSFKNSKDNLIFYFKDSYSISGVLYLTLTSNFSKLLMDINDELIELFIEKTPDHIHNLAKIDEAVAQFKDPDNFWILCKKLINQGYYKEVVKFLNYTEVQSGFFTGDESKYKRHAVKIYLECFYGLGKINNLIDVCKRYKSTYPNDIYIQIYALTGLFVAYKNRGDYDSAFNYMIEMIKLINDSDDKEKLNIELYSAVFNIGVIFQEFGYIDKALRSYDHALKILDKVENNADRTVVWLNKALCLFRQDQTNKAIDEIDQCLLKLKQKGIDKIDFKLYKIARLYKARFLLELNKNKAAKDILDDFFPLNKNNESIIVFETIMNHLKYLRNIRDFGNFYQFYIKNAQLIANGDIDSLNVLLPQIEHVTNILGHRVFGNELKTLKEVINKKKLVLEKLIQRSTLEQELIFPEI